VKVKINLEKGKNVELHSFGISQYGAITFIVDYLELGISRPFTISVVMLRNWLKANPAKTWKDYLKTELLRLYNLLSETKTILDLMKGEAE